MLIPYSPSNRLGEIPDNEDREVAQFKWSVGVVGGSVTLRESRWQRFKARFRKRTIEESLGIAGADAFIQVNASDDATLEIQLHLVNFSNTEILIEHIGADWLSVESGSVTTGGATLLPSIGPVRAQSISGLTIRFPILPAGIRAMANHIREGHHPTSSPHAHVHLRGTLIASRGSTRAPVRFEVHVPTPGIDWPATALLQSRK